MLEFYPILSITPKQIVGDEQLGTKPKFWFEHAGSRWLFKETREIASAQGIEIAGEDWAEKIASEIARVLDISAAEVELAQYQGRRGCVSRNFANTSQQLVHGNEVLAGYIPNYDPGYDRTKWFKQSEHTLENIITAIQNVFPKRDESHAALTRLASYIV